MSCPKCGSKMNVFPKEDICTNPHCGYTRWKKNKELTMKEAILKGGPLDETNKA